MMTLIQCLSTQAKTCALRFSRMMSSSSSNDHLQRTATKPRHEEIAQAEVTEMEDLSSSVKSLKLQVHDQQFSFKAGQWVDMFIPGVETIGGFSMLSAPNLLSESRKILLAVKRSNHPPALWVHTKCKIGSKVRLRVGGDFFYDPETRPRDLLLIAGGVGVNPLFSMLQHFVFCQNADDQMRSVHMLYSARNEEDLIFKDQLLKIMQTTRNVHLKLFTTREKAMNSSIISYGRIQDTDVQAALSKLNIKQTDVFLCGPLPFIDAMKAYCVLAGVSKDSVHHESWW